jgi:hypothetical protein
MCWPFPELSKSITMRSPFLAFRVGRIRLLSKRPSLDEFDAGRVRNRLTYPGRLKHRDQISHAPRKVIRMASERGEFVIVATAFGVSDFIDSQSDQLVFDHDNKRAASSLVIPSFSSRAALAVAFASASACSTALFSCAKLYSFKLSRVHWAFCNFIVSDIVNFNYWISHFNLLRKEHRCRQRRFPRLV